MAIAHAMWVHGSSVQLEDLPRTEGGGSIPSSWGHEDEYGVDILRRGFCARCNPRGTPPSSMLTWWFHFAIPTPVIVDDRRLKAGAVGVRFLTNDAAVRAIHVYDGEIKIASKDLGLYPTDWHVEWVDVPGHPEVHWGLGISVNVIFTPHRGAIEFSAAGCDFL